MKNKFNLFNYKPFVTILAGVIAFDISTIHYFTTKGTIWDEYPIFVLSWFLLIFFIHAITNPKECEEYLNSEA